MRKFIASMTYELGRDTADDARKLLLAELVGRRWQDRRHGKRLPKNCVWIRRSAEDDDNTDDVHDACALDLRHAVEAVRATGRPIKLVRAWIQVAGAGTFGPVNRPEAEV